MTDQKKPIADKLRAKLTPTPSGDDLDEQLSRAVDNTKAARIADLERRIRNVQDARRRNEVPTDRDGITIEGHLASALTKLQRELDRLR